MLAVPVGTEVVTVTAKLPNVTPVPFPQTLLGVTVTFPEVDPHVTVIELLPCPAVMLAPAGTVHV
jgi:hypothetical protein